MIDVALRRQIIVKDDCWQKKKNQNISERLRNSKPQTSRLFFNGTPFLKTTQKCRSKVTSGISKSTKQRLTGLSRHSFFHRDNLPFLSFSHATSFDSSKWRERQERRLLLKAAVFERVSLFILTSPGRLSSKAGGRAALCGRHVSQQGFFCCCCRRWLRLPVFQVGSDDCRSLALCFLDQ